MLERAANVHLFPDPDKAKCEEVEKQHLSAQTTPWEDLAPFMNVLQLQEFPYGSRWVQDTPHQSTWLLHPWDGWVGLPHPEALQGPQVTQGFWVTHRKSRQSYCRQCCLMGCCVPLMHQLGIRMTQKWEFFFHLWTNSLAYLEVIRHHLTQNVFVQAVQVKFLRIYFGKCSYQNPEKPKFSFFLPLIQSHKQPWTKRLNLRITAHCLFPSPPHSTPPSVWLWLKTSCFIR